MTALFRCITCGTMRAYLVGPVSDHPPCEDCGNATFAPVEHHPNITMRDRGVTYQPPSAGLDYTTTVDHEWGE